MFLGHTAVALVAKAKAPMVPLGWLVAAAFALDLLWPILILTGLEQVSIVSGATAFNPLVFVSYPWSHSLLMACFWGLCAMGAARLCGVAAPGAGLVGAVVVSHWVLDYIVHVPDLPLWFGQSPLFGLGLWNSIPGTFLIEGFLLLFGITIYLRATRAIDRIGSYAFWAFVLVSAAIWASGPWSAPPPSSQALAWFALSVWVLVVWAGWIDRHRKSRAAA